MPLGRAQRMSTVGSGRVLPRPRPPWGHCGSMPAVVLRSLGPVTAPLYLLRPGSAQHLHPSWAAGGLWQTGSQEPCLAVGPALSSAPGLSRHAHPSYASSPGLCHSHEPCHFAAWTPNPSPRDLLGPSPGTSSFWAARGMDMQMCWQPAAPAVFQRRRVSTWARGAVPTSTAAATTETSCQKGTAAASRHTPDDSVFLPAVF